MKRLSWLFPSLLTAAVIALALLDWTRAAGPMATVGFLTYERTLLLANTAAGNMPRDLVLLAIVGAAPFVARLMRRGRLQT